VATGRWGDTGPLRRAAPHGVTDDRGGKTHLPGDRGARSRYASRHPSPAPEAAVPRLDAHEPGRFCWIDLLAHDLGQAAAFYTGLFGWTVQAQATSGGPPYSIFLLHGDPVAGVGEMSAEMRASGMPALWNNYVAVKDVDTTLERVVAAGGSISMPAMDVMDYGRMAFLQDPGGAHLAIWQAGTHCGAARTHEAGAMCWNELATRDVHAAARFFGEVFGWGAVPNPIAPTDYLTIKHVDVDGGGLLQMNEQWGEMPSHWSVYFEVNDAQASAARVTELGGTVHFGPFEAPVGHIAVCADSQGASFYLIQLSEELRAAR
jgi:uncharacterized protein